MGPGGGCIGCPPLLPGPDLEMGFPSLGGAPDRSIFLRSSLKGSSFFDGLSVKMEKREIKKHESKCTKENNRLNIQSFLQMYSLLLLL